MNGNPHTKRAFTLIELLVVIAIIAILAAILFPVFAQAKLAAKKAVSVSNAKQLALGLIMYTADYDDTFGDSEWGAGNTSNIPIYDNWANDTYPYIKAGVSHPERGYTALNNGGDELFHDPVAPSVEEGYQASVLAANPTSPNPTYQWGFSYGVNENIMVHNDYSYNSSYLTSNQLNNSALTTSIDDPTNKILLLTKGVQSTAVNAGNDQAAYSFPYFTTVEWEWLGEANPHYVGGVFSNDGDDSAIPYPTGGGVLADGFVTSPNYDTDCNNASCHGSWEVNAMPRYRYGGHSGIAAFTDGHVKAIVKGQLKWYKNIFVQNNGIYSGNQWGAPGEADCWGGTPYQYTPY